VQKRESRVLDTGRNVQAFLGENADAIGPSITSCRRNLDDAIGRLTIMAVSQGAAQLVSKGATARRKSLVHSLKKHHMRPITVVAKHKLADVPEFEALAMPTRKLGVSQLVAAAAAMATAAQPHESVFTSVGLPDDFVAELNAAANAVTASQAARQTAVADSVSATAGIAEQEARLRGLFPLIDAIVGPKLGNDAVLLRKWESTKAIGRKPTAVAAQSPAQSAPQSPAPGTEGATVPPTASVAPAA
jgi:hypothetical protein